MNRAIKLIRAASLFWLLLIALTGCSSTSGLSPQQQREALLAMHNEVLSELYASKPDVRAQIANSDGYAVFDNANVNLLVASFGGGHGVVKNQRTDKFTYMQMAEAGIGFGAGVKDFRLVMIFHDQNALARFLQHGWAFGAQADAAAKAGDKGAATGGEATVDNITIYQITKSGIALQATIKGTKFWKNAELN